MVEHMWSTPECITWCICQTLTCIAFPFFFVVKLHHRHRHHVGISAKLYLFHLRQIISSCYIVTQTHLSNIISVILELSKPAYLIGLSLMIPKIAQKFLVGFIPNLVFMLDSNTLFDQKVKMYIIFMPRNSNCDQSSCSYSGKWCIQNDQQMIMVEYSIYKPKISSLFEIFP